MSYSREDADWRDRFLVMLAPVLERELEVWTDQREVIGEKWRPQLEQAIRRSRAALLLVSPDFVASKFIMEQELPALIKHRATPFYVLVRPCLFEKISSLEEVQWAHDPKQALSQAADRDGAIVQICLSLIERLSAIPAPGSTPDDTAAPGQLGDKPGRVSALSLAAEGDLVDVPPFPPGFVARAEVATARSSILGEGTGAFGVTARGLGLHGQGGIGKTVLAVALANDEDVRRHFPDGILWVTLGEHADLVAAQRDLLIRLGADADVRTTIEGKAALTRALADHQCLLIVDDVWSGAAAAAFRVTGPHGRVLYTTRDLTVLKVAEAEALELGVLPDPAARHLLAHLAGMTVETLPPEADLVLDATGRIALALALIGAALGAGGTSWPALVQQLKRGANTFLSHPYANTFKAMHVAVSALADAAATEYRSLAIYPQDTRIPVNSVTRYWAHLWGHSPEQTRRQLEAFADREMLTLDGETITFHDLQRDFLLLQADDLPLLHDGLLAAYRTLLSATDSNWADLPADEPYIWEHLLYHLRGAGDGHGIATLVCDLAYLAQRVFRSGPYAAESDLRQAADLYPEHPAITWLLRLFTQWGHLLAGQPTVGDLAATLASRTQDAPDPVSTVMLESLLPQAYLVPQWDLPAAPQALTRVLEGHAGSLDGVAFSPDGRQLAAAGYDGTVRLWDPATGQPTGTLEGHTRWVTSVAFSPDGRHLASASSDGTVRLWDPATGQATTTLKGHRHAVLAVAFSLDGHQLATASDDGTVRLWDPATGQPTSTLQDKTYNEVNGVAFSPDGHQLATADNHGTVRLWDPATGQPTTTLKGHTHAVLAVAFSPDGHQLASASVDGTVRLWDSATGQPTTTLKGHTDLVRAVAFSPDGHQLATAGNDGTVRLWDPAIGQPTTTLEGHIDWVRALAFSPEGHRLATISDDGTVWLRDAATGQPTITLQGDTGGSAGAFSPDGHQLAIAGGYGTVGLWNATNGQPTTTLRHDTEHPVLAVTFSADGRQLASANVDGTVRLWDPATGQPTTTLQGHTGPVFAVAFSPDGNQLATASADCTVRLWDPSTGQPASTFNGHTEWVHAVAFSPDGHELASVSDDGTLRLWDPTIGQPITTLKGHTGRVNAVAFSPDGRRLATGGYDRTVQLWDARAHAAISQLKVGVPIEALRWGPQGIVVATRSGILRLALIERGP